MYESGRCSFVRLPRDDEDFYQSFGTTVQLQNPDYYVGLLPDHLRKLVHQLLLPIPNSALASEVGVSENLLPLLADVAQRIDSHLALWLANLQSFIDTLPEHLRSLLGQGEDPVFYLKRASYQDWMTWFEENQAFLSAISTELVPHFLDHLRNSNHDLGRLAPSGLEVLEIILFERAAHSLSEVRRHVYDTLLTSMSPELALVHANTWSEGEAFGEIE